MIAALLAVAAAAAGPADAHRVAERDHELGAAARREHDRGAGRTA